MNPPPSPIQFLGKYYDNLVTWRAFSDAATFQIAPAPVPTMTIIAFDALFAAFTGGWIYLCLRFGQPQEALLAWIAGLGIGLLTIAGFTAIVLYRYRKGLRLGPYLVYDRATGTLTLPRLGRTVPAAGVRLQVLTLIGWQKESDGGSEIQLVIPGENEPETLLLLTSLFPVQVPGANRIFGPILRGVQDHTPLEVVIVEMRNRTTVAAIKPYVRKGR